jgi:5-methylcytosine-specific restriction protein A
MDHAPAIRLISDASLALGEFKCVGACGQVLPITSFPTLPKRSGEDARLAECRTCRNKREASRGGNGDPPPWEVVSSPPSGLGANGHSQRNPDWTWDEELLAFDVFLRFGPLGEDHPEVQDLSRLLRELTIHPLSSRTETFRNPNGVARKLADIQTHQPGYLGKPTNGSALDSEVWRAYAAHQATIEELITIIRASISQETQVEDDEEEIETTHREGRISYRVHRHRERDPKLRKRKLSQVKKELGMLACQACDSELEHVYGPLGAAIFECHHLLPLHVTGETETSLSDVVLLCPNCHRVAHRMSPWPSLAEMRAHSPKG